MNATPTRHYIPKHAHAKAIAYFMRQHETSTYPLVERCGMTDGVVRTLDRKRPVAGMRVYFTCHREHLFGDRFTVRTSILRFERTH